MQWGSSVDRECAELRQATDALIERCDRLRSRRQELLNGSRRQIDQSRELIAHWHGHRIVDGR
jgi:hypothetical protein